MADFKNQLKEVKELLEGRTICDDEEEYEFERCEDMAELMILERKIKDDKSELKKLVSHHDLF